MSVHCLLFFSMVQLRKNREQKWRLNMITMSDVAKAANVSVMTVSRVLNNSGYVKKKRERRLKRPLKSWITDLI